MPQAIFDLRGQLTPLWCGGACKRNPQTGEPMVSLTEAQKAEAHALITSNVLPTRLGQLEKRLAASGGPYFCGERITACDLLVFSFCSEIVSGETASIGVHANVLEPYTHLLQLTERIANHPRVKKWYNADNE